MPSHSCNVGDVAGASFATLLMLRNLFAMNRVGPGNRAQACAPNLHASREPSQSSGPIGHDLTALRATDGARNNVECVVYGTYIMELIRQTSKLCDV